MTTMMRQTVADLADLPDDGSRYELVRGEIKKMPPPGDPHGRLVLRLGATVLAYLERQGVQAIVTTQSGYNLPVPDDPDQVRGPDLALRLAPSTTFVEGYPALAPDFVIEVVSPNDKAGDIEEKIADYMSAGVRLLWLIYPRARKVRIYQPGQSPREEHFTARLDGADVLPGFSLIIADALPARH